MGRSGWAGAAAILAVCPVTVACTHTGTAADANALTVGVQADVTGIYPDLRNESFSYTVNGNIFEGLTVLDHDLKPGPALADRWENPDDKTWLFHLRPGVHFSDGRPLRVPDVVASLRYAITAPATRGFLASVASVDSVSESVVAVRTRYPFPILLANLSFAFVLPEEAFKPGGRRVGTGPFLLERWVPGTELVLSRNPEYPGPHRPDFDKARFVVKPDAGTRLAALREGKVDLIDNVPVSEMADLRRSAGLRLVTRPALRVLFLAFRTDGPPFSSPAVREAIDLAIDREALVQRALGGFGTPAAQLVPPTVLGYNSDLTVTRPDRAMARRRLREAGYPNGFHVRLNGPTNRYVAGLEIMGEVARQLGEIGVTVEIEALSKDKFFSLTDTGGYQLLLYGWSCETIQAGEALGELVRSQPRGRPPNPVFLADRELDDLIDRAEQAPTLDERSDLLGLALARVAKLRPVLPLLVQNESFAFSNRIEWDPSLDMAMHLFEVHRTADAR